MSTAITETPHSLAAEEAVLGACLLEPGAVSRAVAKIEPRHFYRAEHRKIFAAIVRVHARGEPVNTLTVGREMVDDPWAAPLLSRLTDAVPRGTGVEHYAGIVLDDAKRRDAQRALSDAMERFGDRHVPVDEAAAQVISSVMRVAEHPDAAEWQSAGDGADAALNEIDRRQQRGIQLAGISSGFPDLDQITNGWEPGSLVVLAGATSMGKSALGLAFALNAAEAGHVVGFISLEMTSLQIHTRLIGMRAGIRQHSLRTADMGQEEWGRAGEAQSALNQLPLFIMDSSGRAVSVNALPACVQRLREARGGRLDVIVVDYLGLLYAGRQYDSKVHEVSDVTRALKSLALKENVPVIALAQLNREADKESDTGPQLHHLRDSGSIAQDADIVLLIYRPEYYLERRNAKVPDDKRGLASIDVAKNRAGRTGKVGLHFDAAKTAFTARTDKVRA